MSEEMLFDIFLLGDFRSSLLQSWNTTLGLKALAKPRNYEVQTFPAGISPWMKGTAIDGDKENVAPEDNKKAANDSGEKLFHGSDDTDSSGAKQFCILYC